MVTAGFSGKSMLFLADRVSRWSLSHRDQLSVDGVTALTLVFVASDRCIRALRRLAAAWPEPPFEIETIHGIGYFLKPIVTVRQALPGRLPTATPMFRLAAQTDLHQVA